MQQPRSSLTEQQHALARLNGLAEESAAAELRACCAADTWVQAMLAARPFESPAALLGTSDRVVAAFDGASLEQALAAHGRIGERRGGSAREDSWSRTEQAAALAAGEDVQARLAAGNRAYEERFGHVFLIRAAGRTAEEMYAELRGRLANDAATERTVVLHELAEIVRLRLTRLVAQ